MDPRLPVALREKYGLVHVPGGRRCRDWAVRARSHLAEGLPAEHAGLLAAQRVFPYEATASPRTGASSVAELLTLADP
jgi:hypothetical protein